MIFREIARALQRARAAVARLPPAARHHDLYSRVRTVSNS
jgi:hypothetical protein